MDCPNCGQDMKLVPAGTSKKTGKSYNAFYSCPSCKETVNPESVFEGTKMEAKHYAKTISLPATAKINGVIDQGKKENNRLICRTDLMCALIDKFYESNDGEGMKSMFNLLWSEIDK